jgi:hypothetical protein
VARRAIKGPLIIAGQQQLHIAAPSANVGLQAFTKMNKITGKIEMEQRNRQIGVGVTRRTANRGLTGLLSSA